MTGAVVAVRRGKLQHVGELAVNAHLDRSSPSLYTLRSVCTTMDGIAYSGLAQLSTFGQTPIPWDLAVHLREDRVRAEVRTVATRREDLPKQR